MASLLFSSVAAAEYADIVLADNPVSYYRFEETAGTTATDSSGNNNDGSFENGVTLGQPSVAPIFGPSARFDGINDFVNTPGVVGDDFTLEAWIRTTANSLGGSQAIQGNGLIWSDVAGGADDFTMAVLDNHLAFMTGNPDTTVEGTAALNDGQWHHVVATRNRGNEARIFVDGVDAGSASTNNNVLDDLAEIHIGGNTLDSRYFNGFMDEVAYYDYVLSPQQIRAHYDAGSGVDAPALGFLGLGATMIVLFAFACRTLRRTAASGT